VKTWYAQKTIKAMDVGHLMHHIALIRIFHLFALIFVKSVKSRKIEKHPSSLKFLNILFFRNKKIIF
jgi:hypothetical protein